MIIVKLKGGLGNQMFQYSLGTYLAKVNNTELGLDLSLLLDRSIKDKKHIFRDFDLDLFGIKAFFISEGEVSKLKNRSNKPSINKILNMVLGLKPTYILEKHYHFSKEILETGDNSYLEGYWQSEKYFEPIKDQIKQFFVIKDDLLTQSQLLKNEIYSKNAVCVNVRRGDFVINPFHRVMSPEYYVKAEEIILKNVESPHIYVFSDDIDWCYKNLKFKSPLTFVTHEYNGKKFGDKFRLMSYCKHFIIPNSTFAWWAAYLSDSKDKIVIAPRKWFNDDSWDTKDLLLEDWIKLDI